MCTGPIFKAEKGKTFPHGPKSERQVVTGAGDRPAPQVGPVGRSPPAPIDGTRALGMGYPGHSRVQGG